MIRLNSNLLNKPKFLYYMRVNRISLYRRKYKLIDQCYKTW